MTTSVLYRKILHKSGESFSYSDNTPFTQPLHCHSECELIFFTAGSGKEYIGDAVCDYQSGDLTLIGSNTPHLHLCDSLTRRGAERSACDILQFPLTVFPVHMDEVQEFYDIDLLLKESAYGIKFRLGSELKKLRGIMNRINREHGIKRIVLLYEILGMLSRCRDRKTVSSLNFQIPTLAYSAHNPVDKIYSYLRSNFRDTIRLKDIAGYIGQNPSSMCRLFKQRTGKTIFGVLNEIRIEYACKLLAHSSLTHAEIAYEIGYNNLSYFNKVFKSITHQTPAAYKNSLR